MTTSTKVESCLYNTLLRSSLIAHHQRSTAAMTILSSLLHATNFSSPFLRTLVPSITLAYGLQGLVAVPSILAQSEKFFDLSGSLTYLSCTALSLYLPTLRARHAASLVGTIKPAWPSLTGALMGRAGSGLNWRQVVLSAAVSIWATRCLSPLLLSHHLTHGGVCEEVNTDVI